MSTNNSSHKSVVFIYSAIASLGCQFCLTEYLRITDSGWYGLIDQVTNFHIIAIILNRMLVAPYSMHGLLIWEGKG